MKQVDLRTFNYWADEHYTSFTVTGSADHCRAAFYKEQEKYPTMQYATTISEKDLSDTNSSCYVTIRRFKTKELFRIHHDFPPTYIREGKVI